ncbi:phosphoribosylglycinamide formyltransferase [Granulicella tundricola]|uniref:Phosphoribosylglycinamide formyltransferase n=1 Tax=Granulicella tundricola (strain ATCC BAA-1859 / DSM 23138 / MP5ACTX9) TaxID=1198114 RepID=E8X4U2_GRATM|nr:phosphoribosylglycinamide formyltransferase [Granulicella tundricola]ADW70581.1 phosphoribosylglycinamide formyltransferase [Granulicella tundricola MP5ACTX9]
MNRLGILLSGRGSNFLAIHRAIQDGRLPGTEIAVVLSNKSAAPGLQAARDLNIPAHHIPTAGLPPEERDLPYIAALREAKVDLVCLAGYMRIISPAFVDAFRDRILNVHPSLLPAFPGLESQTQALEFGAKIAGCTVHFVDEKMDHGVIILQKAITIEDSDTPDTLSARILAEEHQAYPEAIAHVLSGQYTAQNRRYIKNKN